MSRTILRRLTRVSSLCHVQHPSNIRPHITRPAQLPCSCFFHSSPAALSHAIVQHRDTSDNNPDLPWDFTTENYKQIDTILSKFPSNYQQSAVLALLTLAQEQNNNWLPISAMNKVAEILDMPPMRVYEVATFYSMYNREPVGRLHIQLCGTTPCQLCGSEKLMAAIEKKYGITNGETAPDGSITVTEVECLGACANAPMIQVNHHEFYENLTEESVINVIERLKNGQEVKPGPQNGQWKASGPLGKTTLKQVKEEEVFKSFRDIDALKEQVKKDAEKAKADAAAAKAAQSTTGATPPPAQTPSAASPSPSTPVTPQKK